MRKDVVRLLAFFGLHVIAMIGSGMALHVSDWKSFAMFGASLVVPAIMTILGQLAATGTITQEQIDQAISSSIDAVSKATSKTEK